MLLQLTREAAGEAVPASEWPQKVFFSRADVLQRMGWGHSVKDNRSLSDSLTRLTAVRIAAKHSFYDARTKLPFADINFGVLDEFAIANEGVGRKKMGATPLHWFKWSDTMHASFTAGNVRSLALEFTLSLQIPTARRLFRFLEMMRHSTPAPRREFSIGVMKLRDRLGMTPYKFPSKIKQILEPAHAELINRGYLNAVEYGKTKDGALTALYRFGNVEIKEVIPLPERPKNRLNAPLTPFVAPMPTRNEIIASLDLADENLRAQACDAVFETLDPAEQDAIRARIKADLSPFLREHMNSNGAKNEMTRGIRNEIEALHPKALKAQISK